MLPSTHYSDHFSSSGSVDTTEIAIVLMTVQRFIAKETVQEAHLYRYDTYNLFTESWNYIVWSILHLLQHYAEFELHNWIKLDHNELIQKLKGLCIDWLYNEWECNIVNCTEYSDKKLGDA